MAPKKKGKKKDDDWEDDAEAIALEGDLEIKPEGKGAAVADDDDDDGGKKSSKKVRALCMSACVQPYAKFTARNPLT